MAIIRDVDYIDSDRFVIITTKDIRQYFHRRKNEKIFLLKCFTYTEFNIDFIKEYKILQYSYKIPNIDVFLNKLIDTYPQIKEIEIMPNHVINKNLNCCSDSMYTNEKLICHLKECESFRYTLFGEPVPKEVLKRRKKRLPPPQCIEIKEPRDYKSDPAFVLYIEMKKMKNLKKAFINELKNIVKINQAKREVIYIVSTTEMQNLNYFKVGGVKTESNLKKRLCQYNIGTVKGLNDYKFLFTYLLPKATPFYQIENELKIKLKNNRIGNTEVYQYPLHSLRSQIENLINENNKQL